MIDMDLVAAHRQRALSPERPKLRGTAQNPDVFFQAREACNPFYAAARRSCRSTWTSSPSSPAGSITCSTIPARPDADRVIVIMGSGIGVVEEAVD